MSRFIIYSRKSTEAEDRQVLSIDSQTRELVQFAKTRGITIDEVVTETKSAKEPGRPKFGDLLARVHAGEIKGILCWKLDRLARNAIDGGNLIHALKSNDLQIVTPTQAYDIQQGNTILMYIEFGVAQQYVDDLSKNVKRGFKTKAENGWFPVTPPAGYVTHRTGSGRVIIKPDPNLFEPIRALWKAIIYESMSVDEARQYVSQNWKLQSSRKRPLHNGIMSRCLAYRILNNEFYAGRFEYPAGSGNYYDGKHKPMVTREEFDAVQVMLSPDGRKKGSFKRLFPYRGLIKCGECQSTITYEEKSQLICVKCKHKFSAISKTNCPICNTSVARMKNPTRRHYSYCHCTKQKKVYCTQPSITLEQLENQIEQALRMVQFPKEYVEWLERNLARAAENETIRITTQRKTLTQALEKATRTLDNLVELFVSPENHDRSLLESAEYVKKRESLIAEQTRIKSILATLSNSQQDRFDDLRNAIQLGVEAAEGFRKASPEAKREIVMGVYSNLLLIDRKLSVKAISCFTELRKQHEQFLREK